MIERLAIVLLLAAAGVVAYRLLRQVHVRRMEPAPVAVGRPTLLYFRSDSCAVCPTQGRYVDQLAAQWGGYIERIDAERDLETAARYGVFTLPTTILLDAAGKVHHVNYGLTDAGKLERQVAGLAADDARQTKDERSQAASGSWLAELAVVGRRLTGVRPSVTPHTDPTK